MFALANAGVNLRGGGIAAIRSPVMWGVLLGLFDREAAGDFIRVDDRRDDKADRAAGSFRGGDELFAVSILCGIGFTMSLFIAEAWH